ncbi:hypothetical protein MHH96_23750 [Niallia sp. FSL K6-0212]|uniref:hypothetical protein n=1 Tax=Niallia sp. FSL K6-0212 TaxID=2921423 RepID=UPI0030F53D36
MNNFQWLWQSGINYVLYSIVIVSGLYISYQIMMDSVKIKYQEVNYKYRIRRIKSGNASPESHTYKHPFFKHISLLIRTTSNHRSDNDTGVFLLFTALLGLTSFAFIYYLIKDFVIALLFGLLLMTVPYLMLRIKLNKLRYVMSTEFLSMVQKLTQAYSVNKYDIYYALSAMQNEIQNKSLRKVTVRLITDLQLSRNEQELKDSIQVFTYTTGTNWSKRLGSIILKGYMYKENVLHSLLVLTKQIEDTEEMLEEEQSQTVESIYDGFLTVPLFIGSLLLGYFTSGAQDWFKLQFGEKWTLFTFCLSVVGTVFSLIISIYLKHPKNDL